MQEVSGELSLTDILGKGEFEEEAVISYLKSHLKIEDKHEKIKRTFLFAVLIYLKPEYMYLEEHLEIQEGSEALERSLIALTKGLLGNTVACKVEDSSGLLSEHILMGILHFYHAFFLESEEHLESGLQIADDLANYFDVWGNSTLGFAVKEQKYQEVFHHTLFYILFSLSLKSRKSDTMKKLCHLLDPLSKGLFVEQSSICALLLRLTEKIDLPEREIGAAEYSSPFTQFVTEEYAGSFTLNGEGTGMGSLCKHGSIFILSMGPHHYPLGASNQFGISYHGKEAKMREKLEKRGEHLHYEVWNQIHHPDESWSPNWISLQLDEKSEGLFLRAAFEAFGPSKEENLAYTFFLKGEKLDLEGTIIEPKTLNRYRGDVKKLSVHQGEEFLELSAKGASELEIIPMAGEGHYWGADYLIAYRFAHKDQSILINIK